MCTGAEPGGALGHSTLNWRILHESLLAWGPKRAMNNTPNEAYSITLRMHLKKQPGMLSRSFCGDRRGGRNHHRGRRYRRVDSSHTVCAMVTVSVACQQREHANKSAPLFAAKNDSDID